MLSHVWVIPAIMAVSFALILLIGKRLPEKACSAIGIGAVGICFVLSSWAGIQWIQRVNDPPRVQTSAIAAANTQPSTVVRCTRSPGLGSRAPSTTPPSGSDVPAKR